MNWPIHRLIRAYTYNTPISKGKYRLASLALRFGKPSLRVKVKDGRKIWVNLASGMTNEVFFFGEYEKRLTDITRALLTKGGVFLDVGANFGWYASLMAQYGTVHAFEPVPENFRELEKNCNGNAVLNQLALGDREDVVAINTFDDLPSGHAALSQKGGDQPDRGNDPVTHECRMTTLDRYMDQHGIDKIDFIKVDIEGAEMMFLKGANKLWKQPPAILMEMALGTTRNFGYLPNDLIKYLASKADYEFYLVHHVTGKISKIDGFAPDDIGGNVFCL